MNGMKKRVQTFDEFPAMDLSPLRAAWRHPVLSLVRYLLLSALVAILFGGWRHLRRFHGGSAVGSNICGAPDANRSGSSGAASGAR